MSYSICIFTSFVEASAKGSVDRRERNFGGAEHNARTVSGYRCYTIH